MKILHISRSISQQTAGYRLHTELKQLKIDSQYLVGSTTINDLTIHNIDCSWKNSLSFLKGTLDQMPVRFYPNRTGILFSPSIVPDRITSQINYLNPTIVNLHWICGGLIKIETLKKINKPIIWTLYDSWPFTGGCHIPYDCERYQDFCGKCPTLGSVYEKDISRSILQRKKRSWDDLDICVIAMSNWMYNCIRKSTIFRDKRIELIPNGINTTTFTNMDKSYARKHFFLPQNKKIVLFGAMNATKDPNKGFIFLQKALDHLKKNNAVSNMELVVFGNFEDLNTPEFGYRVHSLGRSIHSDEELSLVYSAADVFVAPSLSENLPNTVIESLACGTPAVAFKVGGIPDLIDHKVNGYLAEPFDPIDLAHGIEWVLSHDTDYEALSYNARKKILENFNIQSISMKYLNLYKEVLESQ